jgi:hypothetical protein
MSIILAKHPAIRDEESRWSRAEEEKKRRGGREGGQGSRRERRGRRGGKKTRVCRTVTRSRQSPTPLVLTFRTSSTPSKDGSFPVAVYLANQSPRVLSKSLNNDARFDAGSFVIEPSTSSRTSTILSQCRSRQNSCLMQSIHEGNLLLTFVQAPIADYKSQYRRGRCRFVRTAPPLSKPFSGWYPLTRRLGRSRLPDLEQAR